MIAEIVYVLCGVTSIVCALLLLRQYRATRIGLLLWSTICFALLAVSNVLLFFDMVMLPHTDLGPLRHSITLAALLILLCGLIRQR